MEKGLAIFLRKGGLPLRLLIFVQSISRVTHMHGNNLFSTFSEPPEGEWWENPFVIKGGERIAKEKKVAVVSKSHADVIVSRAMKRV